MVALKSNWEKEQLEDRSLHGFPRKIRLWELLDYVKIYHPVREPWGRDCYGLWREFLSGDWSLPARIWLVERYVISFP